LVKSYTSPPMEWFVKVRCTYCGHGTHPTHTHTRHVPPTTTHSCKTFTHTHTHGRTHAHTHTHTHPRPPGGQVVCLLTFFACPVCRRCADVARVRVSVVSRDRRTADSPCWRAVLALAHAHPESERDHEPDGDTTRTHRPRGRLVVCACGQVKEAGDAIEPLPQVDISSTSRSSSNKENSCSNSSASTTPTTAHPVHRLYASEDQGLTPTEAALPIRQFRFTCVVLLRQVACVPLSSHRVPASCV
jgi:hypothetical protein